MSGQWEVVGKKKEKANAKPAPQANKKTKPQNTNVKVQDVLAKSQVKVLFSNGKNKENNPIEVKKAVELNTKKVQKKQENKSSEVPKPKAPKSIESALKQIDPNEFTNAFESCKLRFPDAPIVWLKDLVHFLNQRINLELQDPVFSIKPKDFPYAVIPPEIKLILDKAIEEANKSNIQLFFDISLTSMATDMSKNLSTIGNRIFLQYIALKEPELVALNLSKHCLLRSSYQNRPNIGLSILWAVGQAGVNNFKIGLKVFEELMLPLIEMKHYTKYVVTYLLDLINNNHDSSLTVDQFLFILDVIFSNRKNFPADLKQSLIESIAAMTSFVGGEENSNNSMEVYLKKLKTIENLQYRDCVCHVIVEEFAKDSAALQQWGKIFLNNIASSTILLQYMDTKYKSFADKINRKAFLNNLNKILDVIGAELETQKKKDTRLIETKHISQTLIRKMTTQKKARSPVKLLFITSCLVVTAIVYYDIRKQGNWQQSNTNRILEDCGVYQHSSFLYTKIQSGLLTIDESLEQNFPNYRKKVTEVSDPYVQLARNFVRIFYNVCENIKETIQEKYPLVVQSIESYAPGVVEQSQTVVSNVWSSSVLYFNRSVDYLRKEVFVGQLSPENMQKVVIEALNTTQNKASEYYYWLYEKVQKTIN